MAKTKISEYDATAGNNTDIDSVNSRKLST